MTERLHPESHRQISDLIALHGWERILYALKDLADYQHHAHLAAELLDVANAETRRTATCRPISKS